MEIVIAAAVLAAGLVIAALLLVKRAPGLAVATRAPASPSAGTQEATMPAAETGHALAQRQEIGRLEERLSGKEAALEVRVSELDAREQSLEARLPEAEEVYERHVRELERLSGISASQAKHLLLKELEDQIRHDSARLVRQIEEETKREADRRVRNILAVVMQRLAAGHAAETTVSVVQLPADDMKGRIIGREGRNIRALEHLTGVDLIIDDTPNAVILSGFDGVRREIARMTLEKLLSDGRIHPARIEETYYQAKSELESHIAESGEQAALDANVQGLDPEIDRTLGRLKFRTSYGQNVLAHSVECAHLPAMMAAELGASARPRPRGAAARHRQGRLARGRGSARARRRRPRAPPRRVRGRRARDGGAPQRGRAADRRGGHRPGRRRAVGRAAGRPRRVAGAVRQAPARPRADRQRHPGVDKVYAMQAGREIRVIILPDALDDDGAVLLSHEIAREIEHELDTRGRSRSRSSASRERPTTHAEKEAPHARAPGPSATCACVKRMTVQPGGDQLLMARSRSNAIHVPWCSWPSVSTIRRCSGQWKSTSRPSTTELTRGRGRPRSRQSAQELRLEGAAGAGGRSRRRARPAAGGSLRDDPAAAAPSAASRCALAAPAATAPRRGRSASASGS